MKYIYSILSLLCILVAPALAQQPTGQAIMENYEAQNRTQDTFAEVHLTLRAARGGTRERDLTMWTRTLADDTRQQLIRFDAPADVRGTGFLSLENTDREDDNWLYLPALRKTRRIAGTDKRDRFAGTDFFYEDLTPEKLEDFTYALQGEDTVEGTAVWVVEAVPVLADRIAETAYGKRELWISKDHAVLLQAKFYDHGGGYMKRLEARDVRQVPGTAMWWAYTVTMEDMQEGSQTELVFNTLEIDQGVPEDVFSQRYLKRGQ